jgi:hypothetical protein
LIANLGVFGRAVIPRRASQSAAHDQADQQQAEPLSAWKEIGHG